MISSGGYSAIGTHQVVRLIFTAISSGGAALNITKAISQVVAYADSSNILQAVTGVTGVTFNIQSPLVIFSLLLPARSSLNQAGVSLQVFTPGGVVPVSIDSNLSISSSGSVSDPLSSFVLPLHNATLYDVRITVPGFLSRRINNLSNILTTPYTLTQSQALIPGDFDGNNQITIGDVGTAIRALNGGTDALSLMANLAFSGPLSINNIVTVILNFNTYPLGQ